MRVMLSAGLTMAMLVAIGCSSSTTPSATTGAKASGSEKPIELKLLSIADIPTEIASRQGKVVVLDMWATW